MFKWTKWPEEFTLSTTPNFSRDFPYLQPQFCEDDVSSSTPSYNCIAWAASITTEWWEPDPFFQYHWPDSAPREYTVDAYVAAFRTKGFDICADESLEPEFEKIALYASRGEPTHAARQLPDGNWTSKMGTYEDFTHTTLLSVGGPIYGSVRIYMKRKIV